MKIIYYTDDKTGKIVTHHKAGEMPEEELVSLVEKNNHFSAKARNGKTAHIAEIKEGSLEEYLYNQAENRRVAQKESVQSVLKILKTAHDEIMLLNVR